MRGGLYKHRMILHLLRFFIMHRYVLCFQLRGLHCLLQSRHVLLDWYTVQRNRKIHEDGMIVISNPIGGALPAEPAKQTGPDVV